MQTRRQFVLTLTAGLVALAVVITPVIAEELLGVLTKIEDGGKKLTVESKEDGKEITVTTNGDTEYVTKKGNVKFENVVEKLEGALSKIKDAGKKGIPVKVTHDKGVASRIEGQFKKKAEN
jgi:biopolymer transport protein ExbD